MLCRWRGPSSTLGTIKKLTEGLGSRLGRASFYSGNGGRTSPRVVISVEIGGERQTKIGEKKVKKHRAKKRDRRTKNVITRLNQHR